MSLCLIILFRNYVLCPASHLNGSQPHFPTASPGRNRICLVRPSERAVSNFRQLVPAVCVNQRCHLCCQSEAHSPVAEPRLRSRVPLSRGSEPHTRAGPPHPGAQGTVRVRELALLHAQGKRRFPCFGQGAHCLTSCFWPPLHARSQLGYSFSLFLWSLTGALASLPV